MVNVEIWRRARSRMADDGAHPHLFPRRHQRKPRLPRRRRCNGIGCEFPYPVPGCAGVAHVELAAAVTAGQLGDKAECDEILQRRLKVANRHVQGSRQVGETDDAVGGLGYRDHQLKSIVLPERCTRQLAQRSLNI